MSQILVGADPEVFLRRRSDNKLVSAYGHVLGTKEQPFLVKDGAVQLDGMAAEFNINPASSPEEFSANVLSVMEQLQAMVGDEFSLAPVPVAHFGSDYINTMPEHVKQLGCTVDWNAYTGRPNTTPDAEKPFRTGAGHIHIGFTQVEDEFSKEHMADCRVITAILDSALGMPLAMFAKDAERRELYGQFGSFRPKKYGLEYRVPSNFWLKSKDLMEAVAGQVQLAVERVLSDQRLTKRALNSIVKDVKVADQYPRSFSGYTNELCKTLAFREKLGVLLK